MRLPALLAALAAFLTASPASADITARYRTDETVVTAQINSRGDSRTQVNDATYLTRDGIDYLLVEDSRGDYVARLDDFAAMMRDLMAATTPRPPAGAPVRATFAEAGTEVIAGRTGRVFRLGEKGRPSETIEVVISSDPDLAPLGQAMSRHFGQIITAMTSATPPIGEALRDILARGTLLRMAGMWRLESVDFTPLPQSVFDLPSPPISRAELEERLSVPDGL